MVHSWRHLSPFHFARVADCLPHVPLLIGPSIIAVMSGEKYRIWKSVVLPFLMAPFSLAGQSREPSSTQVSF